MGGVKVVTTMLVAGLMILGAGAVLASTEEYKALEGSKATATQAGRKSVIHRVRGEVTAVEPLANPMTLTVKAMQGKKGLTVGADVTEKTIIREGKAKKTLADIKVGDRVWMKYERTDDKLVADVIRILKPIKTAAKSGKSEKAAPAAATGGGTK